jgi:hypothetical protein
MNHGLMRFMKAHGQTPAQGQRPGMAGALGGLIAGAAAVPVLLGTGAAASVAEGLDVSRLAAAGMYLAVTTLGGALYGAVFRRAASDRRGGWLFGISSGFLLWMVGPITLLQALLGRPLAVGTAAMGLLAAHLLSGLVLGLLFRPMHGLIQGRAGKRALASSQFPAAKARPVSFPETRRTPR